MPVNWPSDPLYALLVTQTGETIADNTKRGYVQESDFNANEITATGYTARGTALPSLTATQTSHVVTLGSASVVWNAFTGSAYGLWVVSHQSTAGASPAVGFWDFGGSAVTATGAALTVTVASGWLTASGG